MVDDELAVRKFIAAVLKGHGYRVLMARNRRLFATGKMAVWMPSRKPFMPLMGANGLLTEYVRRTGMKA